ncbi:MAG: hypothetical protein Q8P64_16795 [Deltaproteobacteria bacterium]|nr:hypothetical protein [Deltaproteobacteria bacterium]
MKDYLGVAGVIAAGRFCLRIFDGQMTLNSNQADILCLCFLNNLTTSLQAFSNLTEKFSQRVWKHWALSLELSALSFTPCALLPASKQDNTNFFVDNIFPLFHKILTIEDVTPEPFDLQFR